MMRVCAIERFSPLPLKWLDKLPTRQEIQPITAMKRCGSDFESIEDKPPSPLSIV
jgi:hypothetical protein